MRSILVAGGLVLALYAGVPALALGIGALLSLSSGREFFGAQSATKYLMQVAIVLLGFTLELDRLWTMTREFAPVVSVHVLLTLALGLVLGYALAAGRVRSTLLSSGTAICGGTTIVSLSPIIGASPREAGVCLSIVFLLNGFALLVLPWIGEAAGLSERQFGLWVALAVHDTSSVLGAAAAFGGEALEMAITVKLGRTLWLVPFVFVTALVWRQEGQTKVGVPLFVVLFVFASLLSTVVDPTAETVSLLRAVSRAGLVAALFFVGMQMTRRTIRDLGGRALVLAVLLWIVVLPVTFALAVHLA